MARYILVDNNTGYIFGDTALLGNWHQECGPEDAARMVDADAGEHGRRYVRLESKPSVEVDGYDVYRADVDGSEAVVVVHDGQDEKTIAAVERDCEYVCFIVCEPERSANI